MKEDFEGTPINLMDIGFWLNPLLFLYVVLVEVLKKSFGSEVQLVFDNFNNNFKYQIYSTCFETYTYVKLSNRNVL